MDRNTSSSPASLFDLPSLSARRAWIEIEAPPGGKSWRVVALRKESVDRNPYSVRDITGTSEGRSPQGERG